MADSDTGGSAANVRFDDIVARVIADPAQAQGATLLSGFIGKGDADGRVRIYPDLSFGSWYDVGEADVLHSVPLPKESSPLGGSYVWVKQGAQIKPGPAQPQAGAGAAAFAAIQPTIGIQCRPTMVGRTCPSGDCTVFGTCAPDCTFFSTCQQPCPPHTQIGVTCPSGDCTFFGNCPPTQHGTTCPRFICTETCPPQTHVGATCPSGDCTFFGCPPTQHGTTCPRFICTETCPPPTQHGTTCPRFICTETCPPTGLACAGAGAANALVRPTPTATFFHTCGTNCGGVQPTPTATFFHTCGAHCASGVLTIVCTYAGCHQGWTVPQPTPTATFNPTLCTQCFVCPPVTAPQTRTGVFNPFGG